MPMPSHILITESALDSLLTSGSFDGFMPLLDRGNLYSFELSDAVTGYRVASEPASPLAAFIGIEWLEILVSEGAAPSEVYRRIARVMKGLRSPPIHLPRQWAEYHHRNLLAFFALPREISNLRWIVDISGEARCARFDRLTSADSAVELQAFSPKEWPKDLDELASKLLAVEIEVPVDLNVAQLAQEFDLNTIGSGSVVEGRTFEDWISLLTKSQEAVLANPVGDSIRIVGPAGSGKTLALCMRALQVSRDPEVVAQGKRVLLATHSWAMSERIDGVLTTLNGGLSAEGITVFPLLSLLELHAGHIGNHKTNVIGDDSTDGRAKSLEIIGDTLAKVDIDSHPDVSRWIRDAVSSARDSRLRLDLTLNLYEELTGVLTASGVAPDDHESIQTYLGSDREDWMPPFDSIHDRSYVISIYRSFMQELIDRGAITTDQFILDSIRVLETFTWRMRKETDGYDFIFIDELQLFDPQERASLELLGRSRRGVPFVTAEDPAQGVFSALNGRRTNIDNAPVYLEVVHRFNVQIFEFINFIYQKFPLNAVPLKIHEARGAGRERPQLNIFGSDDDAIIGAANRVNDIQNAARPNERVCVVTLGDVDENIVDQLSSRNLPVTKLESFDDIERLAYSKKSVVVAPWQFIGGTQFSHVVVICAGLSQPNSQFGRLREMVSVYLSCSRATESLTIVSSGYVPSVISDAKEEGLVSTAMG